MGLFAYCNFGSTLFTGIGPKNLIPHWALIYHLKEESANFHSINPGFDAELAEKFLNGIY